MKLTLRYDTDEGVVEANFDSLDEMEKFNAEMKAKIKAQEEQKAKDDEAELKELQEKFDEIKSLFAAVVNKCKEYGMNPEGCVTAFKDAILESAEPEDK